MAQPKPETLPEEILPFAWIRPSSGGGFEMAVEGDGIEALLLPVHGIGGAVLDVVAWKFGAPSRWWLRLGKVSFLGLHELRRACWTRKPVRLVPMPAEWLADGGEALCVLDWSRPIVPLLRAAGEVVPTTPALERRLAAAVARDEAAGLMLRREAA